MMMLLMGLMGCSCVGTGATISVTSLALAPTTPVAELGVSWSGAGSLPGMGLELVVRIDGTEVASQSVEGAEGTASLTDLDLEAWDGERHTLEVELVEGTGRRLAEDSVPLALDGRSQAMRRLQRASRIPVSAWAEEGRLVSVRAAVPAGPGDALDQAQAFLAAHGALHGVDVDLDLVPVRWIEADDLSTVVYHQWVDGRRAHGATLAVHIRADGVVTGTTAHLVGTLGGGPPTLSEREAREIAYAEANDPEAQITAAAELVEFDPTLFFGGTGRSGPAWRVSVAAPQSEGQHVELLIDAHTGEVLRRDQRHAHVETHLSLEINDQENEPKLLNGTCYNFPFDSLCLEDDPCPAGAPADALSAESLSHALWAFNKERYGWGGWNNNGEQVEIIVRVPSDDVPAAQYRLGCLQLLFRDGAMGPGILGHEWTHVINERAQEMDHTGPFSGAVNEHVANVMGFRFMRSQGLASWALGAGTGSLTGAGPTNFGMPLTNHVSQANNTTADPHVNRPILDTMGRLLWEGGTHPTSGVAVPGIGADKVAAASFRALLHHVGECPTFGIYRQALLTAAADLTQAHATGCDPTHFADGCFDGTETCAIINAFAAIGVGDPDQDCDGVPDPEQDGFTTSGAFDADGDGFGTANDACPHVYDPDQLDTDGDGAGDACDDDDDGDGVADDADNCPLVANPSQADVADGDGIGDACDDDSDNDGLVDVDDNCPMVHNPDQVDLDGTGGGDACDPDDDGDLVADDVDNCPRVDNPGQENADSDGLGDACDNCATVPNPDQGNCDSDPLGNLCDDDDDNDGHLDPVDNCPCAPNPAQGDANDDGVGDACDSALLQRLLAGPIELDGVFDAWPVPFQIPLPACPVGPEPWATRLRGGLDLSVFVDADQPLRMTVVDASGQVVAREPYPASTRNELVVRPPVEGLSRGSERGVRSLEGLSLRVLPPATREGGTLTGRVAVRCPGDD